MALFFEIIDGTSKGKKCKIAAGLQIGRSRGDFIVNDPKISSLHAQVEQDAKGELILVDAGSSNGIVINQQKVRSIKIMRGVAFRLGKTSFKIVEGDANDSAAISVKRHDSWQAPIRYALQEQLPKVKKPELSKTLITWEPFAKPLRLSFIQGIQAEDEWILGFGPRQAGAAQADLFLKEPTAPDLAFELFATDEGVEFKTEYPKIVKINGASVETSSLKDNDIIEIGITKIKINYLLTP